MDGIPPIFTFPGESEGSHLCISSTKLAVTTRRNAVASMFIKSSKEILFFSFMKL